MVQDTAVVILNWNGKKLMEEFLPSVATLSQGADVIVADGFSGNVLLKTIEGTAIFFVKEIKGMFGRLQLVFRQWMD